MPVTSRSKRLTRATSQKKTIPSTDRKTRSDSVLINNDSKNQSLSESSNHTLSSALSSEIKSSAINLPESEEIKDSSLVSKGNQQDSLDSGENFAVNNEVTTVEDQNSASGVVDDNFMCENNVTKVACAEGLKLGSADFSCSSASAFHPSGQETLAGDDEQRSNSESLSKNTFQFKHEKSDTRLTVSESHVDQEDCSKSRSNKKKASVADKNVNFAPMLLMNNLPYMGELTFDTRPRRGRKPKKADICHLISKNYGIRFPDSCTSVPNSSVQSCSSLLSHQAAKRSDNVVKEVSKVAGRRNVPEKSTTVTSLWSPARAGSMKNESLSSPPRHIGNTAVVLPKVKSFSAQINSSQVSSLKTHSSGRKDKLPAGQEDQPLNLCVRDSVSCDPRNSGLNLQDLMNLKFPLISHQTYGEFQLRHEKGGKSKRRKYFEAGGEGVGHTSEPKLTTTVNEDFLTTRRRREGRKEFGLVSPLNLPLAVSNNRGYRADEPLSSGRESLSYLGVSSSSVSGKALKKRRSGNGKSGDLDIPAAASSSLPSGHCHSSDVDMMAGQPLFGHAESTQSSNAQVSICKFKFTGGARPSLQEKKMLSVDSGGNFRFYTDKPTLSSSSVRGTKGSGQQASCGQVSSDNGPTTDHDNQYALSTLPKSAKSMSVCMPVRPTSLQVSELSNQSSTSAKFPLSSPSCSSFSAAAVSPTTLNDICPLQAELKQQQRRCNSAALEEGYSSSQSSESGHGSMPLGFDHETYQRLLNKRKRRTRKSLMRERLEKTFKEKGFLIQTQQLESAEGATYCKFRQLRKFTRYLFRSWKDYLPDTVRDISRPDGRPVSQHPHPAAGGSSELGDDEMGTGAAAASPGDHEQEEDDEELDEELVPEVTLITSPTPTTMNSESEENGDMDVDVEHVDDDDSVSSDNSRSSPVKDDEMEVTCPPGVTFEEQL